MARDRRRADKLGPPWCGCCEWSKTNLEDAGTKVLVPRRVEGSTWRVASGTSLQANALELITRSEHGHLSAVLAHKGKLGPNELRQLKTLQITVKGKRVPIQHIKSGDSLQKVLH